MSKKCKISLGKINRYISLIFLALLPYALLSYVEEESKFFNENNLHPIIYSIIYSLGLCLSFIFLIIYKIRNRTRTEKNSSLLIENINISIHFGVKKISKKEKFLWILLVSVIDFLSNNIYNIYWINFNNYLNIWASTITFMSLFSFFLLNKKLYKHHYISIICIIIAGILYNVIFDRFSIKNIKAYYDYYLAFFSSDILWNLSLVLYKFLIMKKYIISYEILFYRGLIELILSIITLIITTKCGFIDSFWQFVDEIDSKEIIIVVSLIFIKFVYYSLILIIIDFFSPFHIFLLGILSEFILYFFLIDKFEIYILIIGIIFIGISLFTILIFIEIIELNCFGLSKMTKKNIELRAKLDSIINESDYEGEKGIDYKEYSIDLINDKSKEPKELNLLNSNFPIDNENDGLIGN